MGMTNKKFFSYLKKYFTVNQNRWCDSTTKTHKSVFNTMQSIIVDPRDSAHCYEVLSKQYTRNGVLRAWILLVDYYSFLQELGVASAVNHFALYRKRNRRAFKPDMERKNKTDLSFDDAHKLILNGDMPDEVRAVLLNMLSTGMRIHEACRYSGERSITGKGSKHRTLFPCIPKTPVTPEVSNQLVLRYAKKAGLPNTHILRKLYATRAVNKGLGPQDLCEIMGWSSIKTAYNYLQPKQEERILEMLK